VALGGLIERMNVGDANASDILKKMEGGSMLCNGCYHFSRKGLESRLGKWGFRIEQNVLPIVKHGINTMESNETAKKIEKVAVKIGERILPNLMSRLGECGSVLEMYITFNAVKVERGQGQESA
jgi:hypothetical protein